MATVLHHPLGQFPDDLVWTGVGARESSCKPFNPCTSDRRSHLRTRQWTGGTEGPGRCFHPVLTSVRDQAEAIIKSVGHLTNQVEVGDGSRHREPILRQFTDCLALPPGSHLSSPPLADTLQFHRADTTYQGSSSSSRGLTTGCPS